MTTDILSIEKSKFRAKKPGIVSREKGNWLLTGNGWYGMAVI